MERSPSDEATAKGHETIDANVRSLVGWGLGVFALLASGLIISIVVFRYFVTHQSLGPPASPFENVRALPSRPVLQVTPARDLHEYLDQQHAVLNSYGWVDQKAGVVRIPIDRAMDLLLQKGLPVRSSAGVSPAAAGASRAGAQGQQGKEPISKAASGRGQ
jgi:hypothetical protein